MLKKILNKEIKNKVYIIAEIGINHNGKLETALELIEKAREAGVDAVKFQKRNIKNIYTEKTIQDPNTQEWNIEYLIKELNTCELDRGDYDIIYEKCNQLKLDLIITTLLPLKMPLVI